VTRGHAAMASGASVIQGAPSGPIMTREELRLAERDQLEEHRALEPAQRAVP